MLGPDSRNGPSTGLYIFFKSPGPIACVVANEWYIVLKDTRVLKGKLVVVTSCKMQTIRTE